jgi:polyisoprenoid-binding protein YceI
MIPASIGTRAALALLCLTLLGPAAARAQSDDAAPADAANAPAAGSIQLVLDPNNSQASYHAREQLAGNDLPSDAVGSTHSVSGTVVVNPDGSVASDQSQINVDLSSLTSDEDQRDNFIKRNTLQVQQFPTASFVPTQVAGLALPLPTAGQQTFQLLGNLTVHGVTQPATWQVTAQFGDASVSGDATTDVHITDFGMTIPHVGPVLSLNDALTLELQFAATSSP